MKNEELVSVLEFCTMHRAEMEFVSSLKDSGLVEFVFIDGQPYVSLNHLRQLEKMVTFHYDLNINLEGIETIINLLTRIDELQEEIGRLRERLRVVSSE